MKCTFTQENQLSSPVFSSENKCVVTITGEEEAGKEGETEEKKEDCKEEHKEEPAKTVHLDDEVVGLGQ